MASVSPISAPNQHLGCEPNSDSTPNQHLGCEPNSDFLYMCMHLPYRCISEHLSLCLANELGSIL